MTIELIDVDRRDSAHLEALLDAYLRELRTFREMPLGAASAADYPYLEAYWSGRGRHPLFIQRSGCVLGFALVRDPSSTDSGVHEVAKFYIKPENRRQNVGRNAVRAILNRFPGKWELQVHAQNKVAQKFWAACARELAEGVPEVSDVQAKDGHRIQFRFNVQPAA